MLHDPCSSFPSTEHMCSRLVKSDPYRFGQDDETRVPVNKDCILFFKITYPIQDNHHVHHRLVRSFLSTIVCDPISRRSINAPPRIPRYVASRGLLLFISTTYTSLSMQCTVLMVLTCFIRDPLQVLWRVEQPWLVQQERQDSLPWFR